MVNRITIWCVCFSASALFAAFWPVLPTPSTLYIMLFVGGGALFPTIYSVKQLKFLLTTQAQYLLVMVSGALMGALWVASLGYIHQSWQLPISKIQKDVTINAQVIQGGCIGAQELNASASKRFINYTVFVSVIDKQPLKIRRKMQISQRLGGDCLHNGDTFGALVKLKPAYGLLNPVSFSRQQYLVSQQIVATGYLKQLDRASVRHQHTLRFELSAFLATLPLRQIQWFEALLLGQRSLLTDDDWRLIQRTGTAHLFSISGMHLGIITMAALVVMSGGIFSLRMIAGQHSPLVNVRTSVIVVVLVCAAVYTLLSGLALPVVRAFVLLLLACGVSLCQYVVRPFHLCVFMVFICIILFPLSLLQASFYLSVGAVLSILFLNWRFRISAMPWYKAYVLLQLGVTAAMAPVTLLWFGSASLCGFFVNLLVIPLITLGLPFGLAALFVAYFFSNTYIQPFALRMLQELDSLMTLVIQFLQWASDLPNSVMLLYPEIEAVMCLLLALTLWVMPRWRNKPLCVVLLFLPILLTAIPYSSASWFLHVFDAGQGTAIAVTRGNKSVIIDTGPAFNGKSTIGEQVIPAFLNKNNSMDVEYVIHSHDDLDHAGGKNALTKWLADNAISVAWISPTQGCEQGKVIQWQGLDISFLWPPPGNEDNNNAMSCVIKIADQKHSVLLPGDIEKTSEYALLRHHTNPNPNGSGNNKATISANVLLAPHHGSKTSSTEVLIKAVDPTHVIYTQGYENRWGFPHREVYDRYKKHGVKQLTTSEYGYIRVEFSENDYIVTSARDDTNQRWYLPKAAPRHLIAQ